MKFQIRPMVQIDRVDDLIDQLKNWSAMPPENFMKKSGAKGWRVIEVFDHITIAQSAYNEKIESAINMAQPEETKAEIRANAIPSFLIKRFPPQKNGVIKMKMKTMKQFEPNPLSNPSSEVVAIKVQQLHQSLLTLKQWIEGYQKKQILGHRFNSAIGPLVRFNVPEACEFILCHTERHFQQVRNILNG